MKLSDYPSLSDLFRNNVYKKYFDGGGDPNNGILLVDAFLDSWPYYPEALVFKARMLIVKGENEKASEFLKAARKIDEWRINYLFDEAEILYKTGKKPDAVRCLRIATESLLKEGQRGVKNFLLSLDNCGIRLRDIAERAIRKEMIRFLSDESDSVDLDEFLSVLESEYKDTDKNDTE
ncbi:tetratricopeptide repeat protein [Desulfonema magnum]|uniref:Tetratricopeptide domain-containing protein n=1 Tax=Desulfonema magnum TaxID=45655 RepID=A0A975BEP2_9BACT|nr:hypothetical protein [Desulfonema magnum]QTA84142.1 tetratricopeptide domain-containing protein [Desulfonema magnum]